MGRVPWPPAGEASWRAWPRATPVSSPRPRTAVATSPAARPLLPLPLLPRPVLAVRLLLVVAILVSPFCCGAPGAFAVALRFLCHQHRERAVGTHLWNEWYRSGHGH